MELRSCAHCGEPIKKPRQHYYCSLACRLESKRDSRYVGQQRIDTLQLLQDAFLASDGYEDEMWVLIDSLTLQVLADPTRKVRFAERKTELHGRIEWVYYRITDAGHVLLSQLKLKAEGA